MYNKLSLQVLSKWIFALVSICTKRSSSDPHRTKFLNRADLASDKFRSSSESDMTNPSARKVASDVTRRSRNAERPYLRKTQEVLPSRYRIMEGFASELKSDQSRQQRKASFR